MPPRYRCTGRVFPNGPATSRVGCDRRSPHSIQVSYADGNGPYHFHEFERLNLHYTGQSVFGRDPRVNWNLDQAEYPGQGLEINAAIERGPDPDNPFTLRVDFKGGFPVVHQVYEWGPLPWIHWEDFLTEQELPYSGAGSPGPWIVSDVVVVRIAKYADLPADICIL